MGGERLVSCNISTVRSECLRFEQLLAKNAKKCNFSEALIFFVTFFASRQKKSAEYSPGQQNYAATQSVSRSCVITYRISKIRSQFAYVSRGPHLKVHTKH